MDIESLRAHVECLADRFELVTCSELVCRIRHGVQNTKPVAAITFDDGYAEIAGPVLDLFCELGIPATLFAPTAYLDRGNLIWPMKLELICALLRRNGEWPSLKIAKATGLVEEKATQNFFVDAFTRKLHSGHPETFETTLESLCRALDLPWEEIDRDGVQLKWEELRRVHDAGWEIGSHSVHHPWFPLLPAEQRRTELTESAKSLSDFLGTPIKGFCCPKGLAEDIAACSNDLLTTAGYAYNCTSLHGLNRMHHNPPMHLQRTYLRDETPERFEFRLAGGIELAAWAREKLRR
ncbi:MAG: polysaccharide deacetylase family protein [Chrysiogenetes bacterium]|nr:polysaccharide deacetylase family protein [Chrysiogenetes bacterium]